MNARIAILPESWPFKPRMGLGPWARIENLDLGELGAGWVRIGPPGLDLSEATASLGEVYGRGGVQRRGQVVLRPYRRGGAVRHVNQRTYLNGGRFQKEAEIHRALWEHGFPTVEPLGYAFRPHAWGVEGLYFTRYVKSVPWAGAFARTGELLPQFARLIGALSEWGLWAPDLNATNFIIDEAGSLLALDWDRAGWTEPGKALHDAYLRRLARSLQRLGATAGVREMINGLPWQAAP